MKGIFVTFEGTEGCGKTTQAKLLADLLSSMGFNVICTKDPGGTAIGEKIREILLDTANFKMAPITELFLFLASRHQLIKEKIKDKLDAGYIVISSRYTDATLAYQGYGRGLDLNILNELNNCATDNIYPDLTILLDIEPEKSVERVKMRSAYSNKNDLAVSGDDIDRIEQELIGFHTRVRDGYLDLWKRNSDRIKLVHADDTIENVQAEVKELVIDVLEKA
ncbi:dTMP kinase [bacterium]|nr:dTMP kinase [bacterium]